MGAREEEGRGVGGGSKEVREGDVKSVTAYLTLVYGSEIYG